MAPATPMPLPPPPLCLPSTEASKVVPASFVDSRTIKCTAPDLSNFLCDGNVLVEACMHDGRSEELYTLDEVRSPQELP